MAQARAKSRRRLSIRNLRLSASDLQFTNSKLAELWSPQQIAGYGRVHDILTVSHETINRHIKLNRLMDGNLWQFLRTARKLKRKRYRAYDSRGRLQGKRSIDDRPTDINQRLTLGH